MLLMSNHDLIWKLWVVIPVFIAIVFLLLIIPSIVIFISNNSYFGIINIVYGQQGKVN